MRGTNTTLSKVRKSVGMALGLLAVGATPLVSGNAVAQVNILEEITVTAQRREELLKDVPISVTAISGENAHTYFEAGEDIRALAARVPSLYAESSNGRLAPRFYMRGLGNTDFDLAASQSVSVIVDEVVQENVILKSFPLFDIERVEVLRGPQGTLFGRNTPAGIVKFDTRKPTEEFSAYGYVTLGTSKTVNFEGAIGGALNESKTLMGRLSMLSQNREDNISNGYTGEENVMGGYNEFAWRGQLLLDTVDGFSALLNVHGRALSNGTASIFRANILTTGSNELNENFVRDEVYFDEGDNNPQAATAGGGSLKLDLDMANEMLLTSITAYERVDNRSLGDIDGGFGASFLPEMGPGFIPFPSVTQDGIDDLDQFTQEFRLSQQTSDQLFWQAGVFYFDSEFSITTSPFFVPSTTVKHSNEAWAVFGQVSYAFTDQFTLVGGLRYTDDKKRLEAVQTNVTVVPNITEVDDSAVSWDLSGNFALNDNVNLFARVASGFRAPTIQGRDIAFGAQPSTATSETITSGEIGVKSTLADDRIRLNASIYAYEIKDPQFSAIGGAGNFVQLINADKGQGTGIDLDSEWLITDNFYVSLGLSYNKTEIKDSALRVAPCGSGQCTVLDQLDGNGNAIVDGNPFPQAPETMLNLGLRYDVPLQVGNLFFQTDWVFQGDTHFFLYESSEYHSGSIHEGGVRAGLEDADGVWEVALFGRNITDEENLKGGIDFNNNTGFVNERRVWGITAKLNFGE